MRFGVLGNKHIPDTYLNASYEQRLNLLAGLLDTDGSVSIKSHQIEFAQKSVLLTDQVAWLVNSLGGVSQHNSRIIDGQTYQRLFITMPRDADPFHLQRKLEPYHQAHKRAPIRTIRSISPVQDTETVCFTVGHQRHLFAAGRDMILTHNTELLIHFCVWLICRDPDIAIMWVSGNSDLASDMVGSVKENLESNTELIEAMFPPGKQFQPAKRRGSTWQSATFTVANRTVIGKKAPTMVALGRGGRILSRDCDFIVCDDIEDHESTQQEHQRKSTRSWMTTQLDSRNEEHTGFVIIGSRQHPRELYGHLLEDPGWVSIVDSAHDPTCVIPTGDIRAHVDCMLFPELRSYRWLSQKRTSAATLGLESHFEMVYLNTPRPSTTTLFIREQIEAAYNPGRALGAGGLPEGCKTIAGLDPSATGYQAGFAWAVDPKTGVQYMIDLDNHLGGGIEEALRLFDEWFRKYDIRHWVIEENGFQRGLRRDPRIRSWQARDRKSVV